MRTLPEPPCQITVQSIARKAAPIWPVARHAFIDNLTVWVRQPLNRQHMAVVAPYHVEDGPAPFPGGYQQQLHIAQPSTEALQTLARIPHMINYTELALNWICRNETDRDEAKDFFDRHSVKRWHRGEVRYVKGVTRYTDRPWAPNNLAAYHDRRCKLTHEPYCVHVEWRLAGRQACQRAGIESAADLPSFDHRRFWEKRFILATVDLRKFGRFYRRYRLGRGAPRWVWVSRSGRLQYDQDLRTGVILFNLADRSTQKLLDRYGRMFRVRDCLIRLDIEHLLPPLLNSDRPPQFTTTDPIPLSPLDIP
jgi:hypothetical protein